MRWIMNTRLLPHISIRVVKWTQILHRFLINLRDTMPSILWKHITRRHRCPIPHAIRLSKPAAVKALRLPRRPYLRIRQLIALPQIQRITPLPNAHVVYVYQFVHEDFLHFLERLKTVGAQGDAHRIGAFHEGSCRSFRSFVSAP